MRKTEDNEGRRLLPWQVLVTKKLDDALERAIREDAHVSKSGFIREVVRRELERLGFL